MKRKVKYAIMQYIPNYERDERINVAVILHSPQDEYLNIKLISNTKRLTKFDDELDANFMKAYFKSLGNSFTYSPLSTNEIDIKKDNLLEEMTYNYVNQFRFKIYDDISIESSCESFIEKLKDNYLYFDIKKEKRVSERDSKEFFAELLRGKSISYEIIGSNDSILGNYDEKINVDFRINNKYYKIINFNQNNIDKYTPTIKMWMLNSIELKEKKEELVFVINEQVLNEKTDIFIKMLSKYAKVIKMDEFNDYF